MAFLSYFEREEQRIADLVAKAILLRSLRTFLPVKYGSPALALIPRIEAIEDVAVLDRIFSAVEADASLEQFTAMFP